MALATRLDRRRWAPSVVCLGPEACPGRAAARRRGSPGRLPGRAAAAGRSAARPARPRLLRSRKPDWCRASCSTPTSRPGSRRRWRAALGWSAACAWPSAQKRWHLAPRPAHATALGRVGLRLDGVRRVQPRRRRARPRPADRDPQRDRPRPFDRAEPVDRGPIGVPATLHVWSFSSAGLDPQKGLPGPAGRRRAGRAAGPAGLAPGARRRRARPGPPAGPRARRTRPGRRVHWLGRRDDVPALLSGGRPARPALALGGDAERRPGGDGRPPGGRWPRPSRGREDLVVPGRPAGSFRPASPSRSAAALLDAADRPRATARGSAWPGGSASSGRVPPRPSVRGLRPALVGLLGLGFSGDRLKSRPGRSDPR